MDTRTAVVGRRFLRGWKLWTLPAPALLYLLAIDALAIGYGILLLADRPGVGDVRIAFVLTVCAIIGSEGARRVEERRRRGGALHKDLQSVWILAAAILLHPAAAVAFALASRAWWRMRAGRCIPYRWVFSTAVIMLGIAAAHATLQGVSGFLASAGWSVQDSTIVAMALAAVAYLAVDAVLCAIAIRLLMPGSTLRDAFGEPADLGVDLIGGGLGCTVAAASMVSPWFAILAVPVTLTAQRALLLHQFELAARTDPKTEVASFTWWRQRVDALAANARRRGDRLAILFVDIDHFRAVNETYGHLVGDRALSAVAASMRNVIRAEDVLGRFGGEEFVVALPGIAIDDAEHAADRLRQQIADHPLRLTTTDAPDGASSVDGSLATIRLTVSIGVAVYPDHGGSLEEVLEQADQALYAAKTSGRDQVARPIARVGVPGQLDGHRWTRTPQL